jgi:hypothetical protein
VVIHRHGQLLLGGLLTNYILIQEFLNLERFRNLIRGAGRRFRLVIFENRVAYGDAFIANICPRVVAGGRDELADYVLTLMTKRTSQSIIGSGSLHAFLSSSAIGLTSRGPPGWETTLNVPIIT